MQFLFSYDKNSFDALKTDTVQDYVQPKHYSGMYSRDTVGIPANQTLFGYAQPGHRGDSGLMGIYKKNTLKYPFLTF